MLHAAVQRAISDRLRMTKLELAGEGLGLELWRLLTQVASTRPGAAGRPARVPEALDVPNRCRDAAGLRQR
eukprot:3724563-Alexandrium_andersonii.AAC.1